ncbi:SPFH domain-containing protein [Chitinivorax sp. PXF-14]|uniref:SPFH domain-containing protein n=1 Tax=Chitinivorax sp. PXF-14 TaxID=3230488 RepID=UPI003466B787
MASSDKDTGSLSGIAALVFLLLAQLCAAYLLLAGTPIIGIALAVLSLLVVAPGLYMLQPNESAVLTLFGKYVGTVTAEGLRWSSPFYSKRKVSLRRRNFASQTLKVNDKRGNPIEIGAVIVWRVEDSAKAVFEVDDYANYIAIQAESAIRHLAREYVYDNPEDSDASLSGSPEEIQRCLVAEIQKHVEQAGIAIDDARLSHLAYAPEIAGVMLRRQQAEAVLAARQKIVHGAVDMVESALKSLSEKQVVELDDERKAAMVSNLLVVLCGDKDAQPVVNTGTLYN